MRYGGSVTIKSTDLSGIHDMPSIQSTLKITLSLSLPFSNGSACPPKFEKFYSCCPPYQNTGTSSGWGEQQANAHIIIATQIARIIKFLMRIVEVITSSFLYCLYCYFGKIYSCSIMSIREALSNVLFTGFAHIDCHSLGATCSDTRTILSFELSFAHCQNSS